MQKWPRTNICNYILESNDAACVYLNKAHIRYLLVISERVNSECVGVVKILWRNICIRYDIISPLLFQSNSNAYCITYISWNFQMLVTELLNILQNIFFWNINISFHRHHFLNRTIIQWFKYVIMDAKNPFPVYVNKMSADILATLSWPECLILSTIICNMLWFFCYHGPNHMQSQVTLPFTEHSLCVSKRAPKYRWIIGWRWKLSHFKFHK